MDQKGYHVALICENGHVVSTMIDELPLIDEKFCSSCGARTMRQCPHCEAPMRGKNRYRGGGFTRPAYCGDCGAPFPWTTAALDAARELAALELSEQDQAELADIIEGLVTETSKTPVMAARMRKLLNRAAPAVAEGFKAILVQVVTEAAKKVLWPSNG